MKKYTLFAFLLISIGTLYCCKPKTQEQQQQDTAQPAADKSVKTLSALYYNYLPETTSPILPQDIQKQIPDFNKDRKGILDGSITDTTRIRRLKEQIALLKESPEKESIDARIVLTINYSDGSSDNLTLSGKYADRIFLNGVQQEANNRLVFFVKNYIGYYPWFIGDDMAQMPELLDTSFMKEPFIRSEYYKQYQEILSKR